MGKWKWWGELTWTYSDGSLLFPDVLNLSKIPNSSNLNFLNSLGSHNNWSKWILLSTQATSSWRHFKDLSLPSCPKVCEATLEPLSCHDSSSSALTTLPQDLGWSHPLVPLKVCFLHYWSEPGLPLLSIPWLDLITERSRNGGQILSAEA